MPSVKKYLYLRFDGPNSDQTMNLKVNEDIKMKKVLFKVTKLHNLKLGDWRFLIERTSKQVNPVMSASSQDLQSGDTIVVINQVSSG